MDDEEVSILLDLSTRWRHEGSSEGVDWLVCQKHPSTQTLSESSGVSS